MISIMQCVSGCGRIWFRIIKCSELYCRRKTETIIIIIIIFNTSRSQNCAKTYTNTTIHIYISTKQRKRENRRHNTNDIYSFQMHLSVILTHYYTFECTMKLWMLQLPINHIANNHCVSTRDSWIYRLMLYILFRYDNDAPNKI